MPFPLPQMFPYGWSVIFLISTLAFFFINSSWSSFFSSPLTLMKEEKEYFFSMKDFWY